MNSVILRKRNNYFSQFYRALVTLNQASIQKTVPVVIYLKKNDPIKLNDLLSTEQYLLYKIFPDVYPYSHNYVRTQYNYVIDKKQISKVIKQWKKAIAELPTCYCGSINTLIDILVNWEHDIDNVLPIEDSSLENYFKNLD